MPQTPHTERHFTGGELVRDIVIGMSNGLTVPFALAAGLSGAVSSARVVVVAGLAEIAAGSIAMDSAVSLRLVSDAEHYEQELIRERTEVGTIPEAEAAEVSFSFLILRTVERRDSAGGRRASQEAQGMGRLHDAV